MRRAALQTALTAVVVVVVFGFVLPGAVDLDAVVTVIRSVPLAGLAGLGALIAVRVLWEGAVYAATLPGLSLRRGALVYVGSSAVAFSVPGPFDLAVRYGMYSSWGFPPAIATAGILGSGAATFAARLLLPVAAAVLLVVLGMVDGDLARLAVLSVGVVAAGAGLTALVLNSERTAHRIGDLLGRLWSAILRLFGRGPVTGLGGRAVEVRQPIVALLRSRWHLALGIGLGAQLANYALLLASLRLTGLAEGRLGWVTVLTTYAVVQLLTSIPVTPGATGVSEVAYVALLAAAVPGEAFTPQIAAGVLLFRVSSWLVLIPVGWVAILVWRVVRRRHGERVPARILDQPPEPPPAGAAPAGSRTDPDHDSELVDGGVP